MLKLEVFRVEPQNPQGRITSPASDSRTSDSRSSDSQTSSVQSLVHVGDIVRRSRGEEYFQYATSYLDARNVPISLSLPLRAKPFSSTEMRPYFDGLLPEGASREAIAAKLGAPQDDYLALLGVVGLDCIGDVIVQPADEQRSANPPDGRNAVGPCVAGSIPWDSGSYQSLTLSDICSATASLPALAKRSEESRLSLAGTQGKIGLAHLPGKAMEEGWFAPVGGAASTHIVKTNSLSRITEFEVVCMGAASRCGVDVPNAGVLPTSRPLYWIERFDRIAYVEQEILEVERLHQEDCAQALGISSSAKYSELDGGTYAGLTRLLRTASADPLHDTEQLARIAVFNYLIGNCDNHLKNLSLIYRGHALRLAPAYDLVCTTFFERFSREMGARIGSTRNIDEVLPSDFELLTHDLGLGIRRMRSICSELVESISPALMDAGEQYSDQSEALPFAAEDIVDDAAARMTTLTRFTRGLPA